MGVEKEGIKKRKKIMGKEEGNKKTRRGRG